MKNRNFLKELYGRQMWHPMAHPGTVRDSAPSIFVGAEGVRLTDVDGNSVIDAAGGLWNVNLGYSNERIRAAITRQLDQMAYMSSFGGAASDVALEISFRLAEFFEPEGLTRAFYTSGGSDSVESALRLARQYHKLRGEGQRTKFISLLHGYHGTHFGGASVNGNAAFRTQYEPLLPGCFHVPAPHVYRNAFGETDPARLAGLCLEALEEQIAFQNPETIAAFIMEPILGAGGVIVPHETFMPGVRDICTRNGILLIADEVVTAFGRTGAWTGSRLWGVKPDMLTSAKAITNAYFPFGAVMISDEVAAVFESDASPAAHIGHGYTYSAHPVGAAAAVACIEETLRIDPRANAHARGAQLFEGLKKIADKHDIVGDVRGGQGLMCAIEFVRDRDTKAPLSEIGPFLQKSAYEEGVLFRTMGNIVIISPPLVIEEADVTSILDALDNALTAFDRRGAHARQPLQ